MSTSNTRIALITGGTRGIGLGIARALGSEGWHLLLGGVRPHEDVRDLLKTFEGAAEYFQGDVASAADRARLVEYVAKKYGSVHALVNNAGRAPRLRADLLEASEESFEELIKINLQGPYFLTQAIARQMTTEKSADASFAPAIVFVTSVSAEMASIARGEYCVSKAGLAMAARLFALRLAPSGIPVFEVRPGIVATDMTAGVREMYDARIADGLVPQKRWVSLRTSVVSSPRSFAAISPTRPEPSSTLTEGCSSRVCKWAILISPAMALRPRALKPTAARTTRRTRSIHVPIDKGGHMLVPDQVIQSPETHLKYRIERFLGQGGFGQAYRAQRIGDSTAVPEVVCIKVSDSIDGWVREAYFGKLLEGHARAIGVYDAFPLMRADGRVLYYLTLEYASHGDLGAYLQRNNSWSETGARREIAGILEVLGKLHRGQLLHRDLTPLNVFVCDGPRLKLGDFGIVRQQSDRRGITVRTMNALTAPSDIIAGSAPKWQARDDVYQVGQLLGMLVKGDARERIRTHDVRKLECSDHLKEIIYRCIGERRKRYETALEMIEALRTPPISLNSGILRTLKGVHIAFTGILSKPRRDAIAAARRAGAKVHGMPSIKTSVVVRGRPNVLQAAGRDGGLKLMEIKRLREKGHRITLLNETQFWKLVARR